MRGKQIALCLLCAGLALAFAGCGDGDTGGGDAGTSVEDASRRDAGPSCEGCIADGVCHPDGAVDPENPCLVCDAASESFVSNDGARCDDGLFCTTDDVCSAGTCGGTARTCDDAIACNGTATCDETAGACVPGTPTCTGGQICDAISGECVSDCPGCAVDGVCYGDGQVSPTDPCLACDVATSRSAFSPNDGARCDDGDVCTTDDVCSAGTCTAGPALDCDDGVACNGAETCDQALQRCTSGTTTCALDSVCDVASDTCVAACTGCVIDGVCYGAGQRNPAQPCEVCAPDTSRSAWSANDGATCDDGLFCTTGDVCAGTTCGGTARSCDDGVACNGAETCDEAAGACAGGASTCSGATVCDAATDACVATCTGCVVDGVCYGEGQADPTNACRVCRAASSRTSFSDATDGTRCDDGLFCTDADVCTAGTCGGSARACSDGVACNGAETCDEATDACVGGTSTCAAGEVCDTAADACVTTCSGCVVGGVCHAPGATSPANACQWCDVSVSRTAFTARTGASCDDGLYCTVGETCSAAGACGGGTARSCSDGIDCTGTETCNESTDRCDAGATTCTGGQICDTAADMCVLSCVGGSTLCGTACVDTTTDPANCGGCDTACGVAQACVRGTCRDLAIRTVLVYFDSFSTDEPARAAATALGYPVSAFSDEAGFNAAYDAGGWDIVVIDVPGSGLPAGVRTRVLERITASEPIIFSWWALNGDAALAAALEVSTSTYDGARLIHPRPGASIDVFTTPSAVPVPLSGSDQAGDNGDFLTPTAGGEILATADTTSGPGVIVETRGGSALVLGFLPWDFRNHDTDTDGTPDVVELFGNLLQYPF